MNNKSQLDAIKTINQKINNLKTIHSEHKIINFNFITSKIHLFSYYWCYIIKTTFT